VMLGGGRFEWLRKGSVERRWCCFGKSEWLEATVYDD